MAIRDAARQIVAIQSRLVAEPMPVARRSFLLSEQRQVWDAAFPGVPFEQIARQAQIAA